MADPISAGTVIAFVGAGVGGIFTKVVYDMLRSQNRFVTPSACDKHQRNCASVAELDRKFIAHKAHMEEKLEQIEVSVERFYRKFEVMADNTNAITHQITEISTYLKVINNDACELEKSKAFQKTGIRR